MKNLALCFIFVARSSCGTIGIVSFNPADWFSKEPELLNEERDCVISTLARQENCRYI